MPKFRKAKKQASHIVKSHLAIGKAKHNTDKKNQIHSVGTARNYEQALVRIGNWLKANKLGNLSDIKESAAIQYLETRAQEIGQKSLDQERQAIQLCIGHKLPVIKSELEQAKKSRAYTEDQVKLIAKSQQSENQLATKIAYAAGLRAHELLTLRRANKQPKSTHRKWSHRRFTGRDGILYTVIGKGGLIREVLIPKDLAKQLENHRLKKPQQIKDRQINYKKYYDIAGGKNWTNSFSAASKRLFNWSHGAHGLRHSYAQQRMGELQQLGCLYKEALEIVSQELGHFRPDITEVYLL